VRGLIAGLLGERRLAVVSGGFDPLHSGHVRMIEAAQQYGSVIVVINTDDWLTRKKGRPFMKWDERNEIVAAMRAVAHTWRAEDRDGTVIASLAAIKFMYPLHRITFCNGGDRIHGNTPEEEFCMSAGIELAYHVGGGKTQSSSWLTRGLSPSPE
jgi:D-beta-D-heptose 7-phosphate kinase/D-beta-D-heptose 1-phosphate adenosyltransferase